MGRDGDNMTLSNLDDSSTGEGLGKVMVEDNVNIGPLAFVLGRHIEEYYKQGCEQENKQENEQRNDLIVDNFKGDIDASGI